MTGGAIRFCVFLIFLASLNPAPGRADETLKGIPGDNNPPVFRRLGTDQGLSNDSVFCMLQDKRGFMWLGTFSGLDRYDGSRVVSYRPVPGDSGSLSASLIFDLHEDASGDIWVATDGGGLDRYRESSDSFEHFRNNPGNPDSLGGDRVLAVADDRDGSIWAGLGGAGLDRLDKKTGIFRHYRSSSDPASIPDDVVRVILSDKSGRLWIGTAGGLALYVKETDSFYRTGYGELEGVVIRALFEDSAGRLWIGTENRGLYVLDPGKEAPSKSALPPGMENVTIRALAEDSNGELWIGTEDSGIVIAGARMRTVGPDSTNFRALSHDNIRSIIADRGGLVWVGTRGGGVNIHNPHSAAISHYTSGQIAGDASVELRQVFEDHGGAIWLATDGAGLVRLDRKSGSLRRYRHSDEDAQSLPGDRVVSLVEDVAGHIWVGTDGAGLGCLDPATGKFRNYRTITGISGSLGGSVVWALYVDRQGTLWVGMEGSGLDRYVPATDSFVHYKARPGDSGSLQGYSVRAILEDRQNRLWVGTWDGGLSLLNRASGTAQAIRRQPGDSKALADASVTFLFEDSGGRVWVGTGGGGLDRLVEQEGRFSFEHFRNEDGLSGNDVVGILEDAQRQIWVVTGGGLTRYSPDRRSVLKWNTSNGFQRRFAQNSLLKTRDGYFFLGGGEGLDVVRPENLIHDRNPPPVVISNIEIIGGRKGNPAEVSLRSRALRTALSLGSLDLEPGDSALVVDFAVLDYTDPGQNLYSFSLRGSGGKWTDLGSSSRAVLTGLAPGEYVLRVRGADSGGVWNEEGASLKIRVIPPLWRRPWFLGLMAGIVALGAAAGVKMRTTSLEKRARELGDLSMHIQDAREEERSAAARDVHDELGQLLTAVKMDLHWLKRHPDESALAVRLDESLGLVDEAMESVKRISTRLRPKALDTLSLSEAISWQLEEFRRRKGIECRTEISPAPEKIDPTTATTLFRVFQEILTNIARHSAATAIEVHFGFADGMIILDVRDNGVGIDTAKTKASASIGILGMRERVRYSGGTFRIERMTGGGTLVVVAIPPFPPAGRRV